MFASLRRLFSQTAIVPSQSVPTVSILNFSSVVKDEELASVATALQEQVNRDFAPVWKTSARVRALSSGATPAPDDWLIYVMDTSDQSGALGYHELTPAGNPVGKIFAMDDLAYGIAWSVTLSHELLEILADPWVQNTVFAQTAELAGTIYALEVCDACQADDVGYKIGDVLVSDFVHPTWFENWRQPGSTRFDQTDHIHAPLTLAQGGYIGIFSVPPHSGWSQITAETDLPTRLKIKGEYSRLGRRQKRWLSK